MATLSRETRRPCRSNIFRLWTAAAGALAAMLQTRAWFGKPEDVLPTVPLTAILKPQVFVSSCKAYFMQDLGQTDVC
jgi:hypothetical protein